MNPAARLHRIYDKLVSQGNDYQLLQTWADVFDIDKSGPHYEDDVTACVMALRSEIALTRKRLDEIGAPANLTSPGFERLREVAAPGLLHGKWHSHRGNISPPECRKVFEWAEWALREDAEPDMPAEDMNELRAELESLEAALNDAEVSPYLRDFIQRQVDTIRAALRVYGVQGARTLQDALQKVAGAYTVERARVEAEHGTAPEATKGLFAKASGVIKKTADVCDNLGKIGKFGEQAWTLAGTVGPLVLPYLPKLGG
ncbi:MAG TPA: hypothetical protein PKV56_06450 [Burkholderiaceae bacterium]|nr:hypothetical protein [Burkholderiaceae bacterium]